MVIDISSQEALTKYLRDKGLFSADESLHIRYFAGGVSATVALVRGGQREILVKQALLHLKVNDPWECEQNRIQIEKDALEVCAGIVPEHTMRVVFYDADHFMLGRYAAPEHCVMWKEQLLKGVLDFRVAEKAIRALSKIHNQTAYDPGLRDAFSNKDFFYKLRIHPYIEWTARKYPEIRTQADEIISLLMREQIALVHGDYSPKNILVHGEELYILDLEVAHFGHPAFDIAFFFNHFLLKAVKNKAWSGAYCEMLRYMQSLYFQALTCVEQRSMESLCVRTLAFLLAARVDGKSPAEYITEEEDRMLIRKTAICAIKQGIGTFDALLQLLQGGIATKERSV